MGKIEEEAEAGAEKKHLHGEEAREYVGGVFNKIRQKHKNATPERKKANKHMVRRVTERPASVQTAEQLRAYEKTLPYQLVWYRTDGVSAPLAFNTKAEAQKEVASFGSEYYKYRLNGKTFVRGKRGGWQEQ